MPFENTVLVLGSFLAGILVHILLMRKKKRKVNPKKHLANIQYANQFLDSIEKLELEKYKYNSMQSQINLLKTAQYEWDRQVENIENGFEKITLEEEALSNAQTAAGRIVARLNTLKPVIQSDNEQVQNIRIELELLKKEYLRQRNNNQAELEFGKQRLKDIAYEKRKIEHEIKNLEEMCTASQQFLDQFNEQLSRSEIDNICMEIDSSGVLKKSFWIF
jgi:chromosome segregation ATPase